MMLALCLSPENVLLLKTVDETTPTNLDDMLISEIDDMLISEIDDTLI